MVYIFMNCTDGCGKGRFAGGTAGRSRFHPHFNTAGAFATLSPPAHAPAMEMPPPLRCCWDKAQSFQAGLIHQYGQPWPASDAPTATPGHTSSERPSLNGTLPKSRNLICVSTSNPSWEMKKGPSPTSLLVTSALLIPFHVPNTW